MKNGNGSHLTLFLSTPSARRATSPANCRCARCTNFYPRPPRGGRRPGGRMALAYDIFLSTPSARRATRTPRPAAREARDFYPRPPRGGRLSFAALVYHGKKISIHALREEGDPLIKNLYLGEVISIHALREEGDSKNREKTLCFCLIIHLSAQIAKRCL